MEYPTLDRWQFRLIARPETGAMALGDRWLSVGAGLPCLRLIDCSGAQVGFILGFVIDLRQRQVPASEWRAPVAFDAADPDGFAGVVLDALGGRFLLALAAAAGVRVYSDVSASVSCVLDVETGDVGATAHALLTDTAYERRFDRRLYDALGVDGEGWFPAGLTAHHGIRRLLPGHCIEVESRRLRRMAQRLILPDGQDPMQLVDEIIADITGQIEALLVAGRRPAIALTAGVDTRTVLACARPFIDRIDVVTVVGAGRHSRDTIVAREIARHFGLHHIELARQTATPEQRALFIRRGGHANGDSNSRFHPSVWPLADDQLILSGLGGECASGFLWRAGDTAALQVTSSMLANRLGLPAIPEVLAALDAWLAELPVLDPFAVLDIAYLENRMGPWSSVQFCADPTVVRMAPMLAWPVVSRMWALPVEWRRRGRLSVEVTNRCWPELAQIPYNSLGLWKDLRLRLQRVWDDPTVIVKKLRKMRG